MSDITQNTVLPKRIIDAIGKRYGFDEVVVGAVNKRDVKIERIWVCWKNYSFMDVDSCMVAIHTNKWKKVWMIHFDAPMIFYRWMYPLVIDISKQGDEIWDYISVGHSLDSAWDVFDGWSRTISIFEKDTFRKIRIDNPDESDDPTSHELEQRFEKLENTIYLRSLRNIISYAYWITLIIDVLRKERNLDD